MLVAQRLCSNKVKTVLPAHQNQLHFRYELIVNIFIGITGRLKQITGDLLKNILMLILLCVFLVACDKEDSQITIINEVTADPGDIFTYKISYKDPLFDLDISDRSISVENNNTNITLDLDLTMKQFYGKIESVNIKNDRLNLTKNIDRFELCDLNKKDNYKIVFSTNKVQNITDNEIVNCEIEMSLYSQKDLNSNSFSKLFTYTFSLIK